MARIRTIKPTFFKSDDVVALSLPARLTWIGLWLYADDRGRGIDDARLVKGDLWLLEDAVTVDNVQRYLDELAEKGRIRRYEVQDKKYFEVVNFDKHQLVKTPSKFGNPAPEWDTYPSPTPALAQPGVSAAPALPAELEVEVEVEVEIERGGEPPQFCEQHPTGTSAPCGPCGNARTIHTKWDRDRRSAAIPRPPRRGDLGLCPDHPGYPTHPQCDRCVAESSERSAA